MLWYENEQNNEATLRWNQAIATRSTQPLTVLTNNSHDGHAPATLTAPTMSAGSSSSSGSGIAGKCIHGSPNASSIMSPTRSRQQLATR
jgi:hypothetical protein